MTIYVALPEILSKEIKINYRFGSRSFNRKIDISHVPAPKKDIITETLLKYLALSDCVYTFQLAYHDVIVADFSLRPEEERFFEDVYLYAMAEFRYSNGIDIRKRTKIKSSIKKDDKASIFFPSSKMDNRAILLNGAGKDSVVGAEILRRSGIDFDLFSSTPLEAHKKIAKIIDKKFIFTSRIENSFIAKNRQLKGHMPLNLYLASLSTLIAYWNDASYVFTSNELSANEPNLISDSFSINHQYTKSIEFEEKFNTLLRSHNLPISLHSIVRPFSDLQLLFIFSHLTKYHSSFVSCNNGLHDNYWCMCCEKCAFTVGGLFLFNPNSAKKLWGDPSVCFDEVLQSKAINLLAPNKRPFECVGTTIENTYLVRKLVNSKYLRFSNELLSKYVEYCKLTNHRYNLRTVPDAQNKLPYDINTEKLVNIANRIIGENFLSLQKN